MRSAVAALLSIGLVSVSSGGARAVQETQKFKSGTQTVPLYVTVTDATRRLVPELVQEDFEILDNGKMQPVTLFDNEVRPITAVVMLDTSGSMTLALDLVKKASEQFLIRLLPDDRGRVGAFNDKIEFFPSDRFTGNRDELIGYLKELDFGYPTRLYDAVEQSMDKLEPIEGRRVVVVFTDGDDTASKSGLGEKKLKMKMKETRNGERIKRKSKK
jgi:Ca-activated chloride channel family protein